MDPAESYDQAKARIGELEEQLSILSQELASLNAESKEAAGRHEVGDRLRARVDHRLLLEQSPVCTKILDRDFNLIYMSNAGIAGLGIDDVSGFYERPYPLEFFPRSFKSTMNESLEAVRRTGKPAEHEDILCDVHGTRYWFAATLIPQFDDAGELEHIIIVSINTTQYHDAENDLRNTNAQLTEEKNRANALAIQAKNSNIAKREFLANMSHEIRTPIAAILGFSESLEDSACSAEQSDAISVILRNGKHLLDIINDILDLSKIEAGKCYVHLDWHDPSVIITEATELFAPRAAEKGLEFRVEFLDRIPKLVMTDAIRVRQILINLLGNAIKFTDRGAVVLGVSLGTDAGRSCLQFDVQDSGIGMTAEQVDRVFQPFTQADATTTRQFGGSGLGLAISKRFAEILDGDIVILESVPKRGTTVRATIATGSLDGIEMAERMAAPSLDQKTPSAVDHADSLTGREILIVDDCVDMRRLFASLLSRTGAKLVFAENGRAGLDAALDRHAQGEQFDCILMDMQMPVMSGYEATAMLRAADYPGSVIAITAHGMDGDREKCIEAGCDDFANKPVERHRLTELITEHCNSNRHAAP